MKLQFLSVLFSLIIAVPLTAQMGQGERKSPPATATGKIGAATVTIAYSQPSMNGREIFGGLVPYEKVWRTGANEATTIEIDRDVAIEGKELKAGKYALFTIPGEKEWEIIFNSEVKQWGAYNYSKDQDVLRVKVKSAAHDQTEKMTFTVDSKGMIYLDWADTRVPIKVKG